ncbi:MAG: metal ABC transporter permease [Opitutaceae bacterium]
MSLETIFLDPFRFEFMQRGLASALFLSVSGGLLGSLLVLRRLALMGDALAHSLLPGIGLSYLFFGPSPIGLFAGALAAGLLTTLGSALISRLTRVKEEAAFAAIFIVLFGLGVALLTAIGPQVKLLPMLFGNILGVTQADLYLAAGASTLAVAVVVLFQRSLILETFDPIFFRATGGHGGFIHLSILALTSINLLAALQAMGIVLALGLFILPAVTAYLWTDRLTVLFGLAIAAAMVSSVAGLLTSYHFGLASGACIVMALGFLFLASALASPRYGMIGRLVRSRLEGRGVLRSPN